MIELNKREKILLQALVVVILGALTYFFIISPLLDYSSSSQDETDSNISRLKKLEAINEQYQKIRKKRSKYQALVKSTKGTTTLIEEHANSLNITRNKVYTRDRPSNIQGKYKKITTDVKFEGVDITSILKFIHKMENSNSLTRISYLRLNQALKSKNVYDATLKFETLKAE